MTRFYFFFLSLFFLVTFLGKKNVHIFEKFTGFHSSLIVEAIEIEYKNLIFSFVAVPKSFTCSMKLNAEAEKIDYTIDFQIPSIVGSPSRTPIASDIIKIIRDRLDLLSNVDYIGVIGEYGTINCLLPNEKLDNYSIQIFYFLTDSSNLGEVARNNGRISITYEEADQIDIFLEASEMQHDSGKVRYIANGMTPPVYQKYLFSQDSLRYQWDKNMDPCTFLLVLPGVESIYLSQPDEIDGKNRKPLSFKSYVKERALTELSRNRKFLVYSLNPGWEIYLGLSMYISRVSYDLIRIMDTYKCPQIENNFIDILGFGVGGLVARGLIVTSTENRVFLNFAISQKFTVRDVFTVSSPHLGFFHLKSIKSLIGPECKTKATNNQMRRMHAWRRRHRFIQPCDLDQLRKDLTDAKSSDIICKIAYFEQSAESIINHDSENFIENINSNRFRYVPKQFYEISAFSRNIQTYSTQGSPELHSSNLKHVIKIVSHEKKESIEEPLVFSIPEIPSYYYNVDDSSNLSSSIMTDFEMGVVESYGDVLRTDLQESPCSGFSQLSNLRFYGSKEELFDSIGSKLRMIHVIRNLKIRDELIKQVMHRQLYYPRNTIRFEFESEPSLWIRKLILEVSKVKGFDPIRHLDPYNIFHYFYLSKNINVDPFDPKGEYFNDLQNIALWYALSYPSHRYMKNKATEKYFASILKGFTVTAPTHKSYMTHSAISTLSNYENFETYEKVGRQLLCKPEVYIQSETIRKIAATILKSQHFRPNACVLLQDIILGASNFQSSMRVFSKALHPDLANQRKDHDTKLTNINYQAVQPLLAKISHMYDFLNSLRSFKQDLEKNEQIL